MTQEVWQAIEEFPKYEISTTGRVRHLKKKRILKQFFNGKGYYHVGLYDNDMKLMTKRVHTLVAKAYLTKEFNELEINHKDGNKENNNLENLEYVTRRENANHRFRIIEKRERYGVTLQKNGLWQVAIRYNGKMYSTALNCKERAYKWFYDKYIEFHGIAPW